MPFVVRHPISTGNRAPQRPHRRVPGQSVSQRARACMHTRSRGLAPFTRRAAPARESMFVLAVGVAGVDAAAAVTAVDAVAAVAAVVAVAAVAGSRW